MIIEPNGIIKIYNDIPIDSDYINTLYFENIQQQTSFFSSISPVAIFDNISYQRIGKGVCRVESKADNLYRANYLVFQNSNFSNKWFYCFINNVEYVNNETCDIFYEIDEIQTYLWDLEILESLVSREHTGFDAIGSNLTPEPITVNEYVFGDKEVILEDSEVLIGIATTINTEKVDGNLIDSVYSGSQIDLFGTYGSQAYAAVEEINNFLAQFIQKPDEVLVIYTLSKKAFPLVSGAHQKIDSNIKGNPQVTTLKSCTIQDTFQGYQPKNAKLYTFPYNYLTIDNGSGQSLSLRYEYFPFNTPKITVSTNLLPPCKVKIYPFSYKGDTETLTTESLTLEGYPICNWTYDAYKNWLAQNGVSTAINTVTTIANSAISNPSWLGVAQGTAGAAINALSKGYSASIAADVCRGNINTGAVNLVSRTQGVYARRTFISGDRAKQIDDFFTMYGYATNIIKKPNISLRPHWNYIECPKVNLRGNAPANSQKKIQTIFSNGITFWKKATEVGDYTLDNR